MSKATEFVHALFGVEHHSPWVFNPQTFLVTVVIVVWAIVNVGSAFGKAVIPEGFVRIADISFGLAIGNGTKEYRKRNGSG